MVVLTKKFVHDFHVRLTAEQYKKMTKSAYSNADFVRAAINQFNSSTQVDKINEEIQFFQELQKEIVAQYDVLQEKIVAQIVAQKKEKEKEIVLQIESLQKEEKKLKRSAAPMVVRYDFEKVLPTLKRMYSVNNHLTDEQLKFQAEKVGCSLNELKLWINENQQLFNEE